MLLPLLLSSSFPLPLFAFCFLLFAFCFCFLLFAFCFSSLSFSFRSLFLLFLLFLFLLLLGNYSSSLSCLGIFLEWGRILKEYQGRQRFRLSPPPRKLKVPSPFLFFHLPFFHLLFFHLLSCPLLLFSSLLSSFFAPAQASSLTFFGLSLSEIHFRAE